MTPMVNERPLENANEPIYLRPHPPLPSCFPKAKIGEESVFSSHLPFPSPSEFPTRSAPLTPVNGFAVHLLRTPLGLMSPMRVRSVCVLYQVS